jgi:hypothetical protein
MSFESAAALALIRRDVSPELYSEIRDLWKAHSIAEDQRAIPGLLATLTEDCVYELPQTGHRWEGHKGADQRKFKGERVLFYGKGTDRWVSSTG